MARIHHASGLLTMKIVYYGPGLSGKTTNLQWLHESYPADTRGDLVKLDTETERTLFFDYFPAELGMIGRYRVKANFFTVPGQSFYNATRRAVLVGADGLVFIADSAPSREEANLVSLANLRENLRAAGRDLEQLPLVFQWNKQDLPGAMSPRMLERMLNPTGAPSFSAVATRGEGVWDTQVCILQAVMERLRAGARKGSVASA